MNENKIKKDWMIAIAAYFAIYLALGLLCFIIISYGGTHDPDAWVSYFAGMLGMSILFLLLYLFAYKGGGTKYIGFVLIMQPIHLFKDLIELVNGTSGEIIAFAICFPFQVWFCLKSYDLFKLNRSLKSK